MKGKHFTFPPLVRGKGEEERGDAPQVIEMIPAAAIVPNPAQPRRDFSAEGLASLADSISRYGIIQPLTVRRPDGGEDGKYELVAGERRLRAATMAGLTFVPCVICEIDRKRSAVLAIIENLQRAELNMFEEAASLNALAAEHGMTQEEIARRLSCSQSYVANKLRLLRLSDREQEEILKNGLTERHARALLRLKTPDDRAEAMSRCIRGKLNVAATEELIDSILRERESQLTLESIPEKARGKRRFILKDIRLFYNSVDHAVDIVRSAGIDIRSRRIETDSSTELRIIIPKMKDNA